MAIEDSTTLKTYFLPQDKALHKVTFAENLIESFINKKDAGITVDGNNIGIGLEAGDSPSEDLK